jgi:competence protein ComEA
VDPLLPRLLPQRGSPARRTVLVLVGVLAAVVLAAAVLLAAGSAGGSTTALPTVRLQRSAAAAPTATPLLVQVTGAVRRPGLVSLPRGARTIDAIAAAGGTTAKADEAGVNLAAPVADGQQVVVPARGAAPPATGGAAAGASAAPGVRVSLAAATAEQLETLPRIGPALAARILAYRTAHGGFRSVAELQQVGGIGPKTFAGLKDLVGP